MRDPYIQIFCVIHFLNKTIEKRVLEECLFGYEIKNVAQPDIAVVCDSSKLDEKGCKGSPDLIVEIISPMTIALDYAKKLALYERNEIREYWIVHPNDKTVMVFTLGDNKSYGKPKIYTEEDKLTVGIFEELVIDLKEVFRT